MIKKFEKIDGKRKLLEKTTIPFETRLKRVNEVLNSLYMTDISLNDHIEKQWLEYHYHKLSTDRLNEENSIILEILSSYLLFNEDDKKKSTREILKHKVLSDHVYNKECIEMHDQENSNDIDEIYENKLQYWEIKQYSKDDLDDFYQTHKRQTKKWRNTSTYKINKIFSRFVQPDFSYYDWINDEWRYIKKDQEWNYIGLIDTNKPYLSKWCYVNEDNEFKFDLFTFVIDKDCEVYQDKKMDSILCFEQSGEYFFFDQNVDKIDSKYILIKINRRK
jgi:hypothetical protein